MIGRLLDNGITRAIVWFVMMAGILLIPVLVVYVLSTLAGGCGRVDQHCMENPDPSHEEVGCGWPSPMTTSTGHP